MPGDQGSPATGRRGRWWLRAVAVAAFVVGAVVLLRHEAGQVPDRVNGDAWEYWYQAESFHRHGSADLWAEDVAAVNGEAHRLGLGAAPVEPYAYATAPDGRMYGVHFWSYALSAIPAKEYLRRTGGCELTSLALTNAAWFALAVGFALFGSSAPIGQRLALVVLATVGPVVWYVAWPGAEVFSWALALIAVVAYRDRRYGLAGLAVGLAATQNPPLVFLGGAAVLAAAWERHWRSAAVAAGGTALVFVPFAFFQYHFGLPNLIAAGEEYVGVGNLSLVRTWGLFTDFNHGLLPFAPVLVVGSVAGAVRLAVTRDVRGLILLAGGVGVVAGVQVAHNWNSGCDGLQRYLVWMIPIAAGVAVEGLAGLRRLRMGLTAVAVVSHAALLYAYQRTDAFKEGYLNHTPLAAWVLTHSPRAYWVEPEVFIERTLQRDGWPFYPAEFPVGYAAPDGTVTKLLLNSQSVERVGQRYEVEPGYLAALRERAAVESGLFYAHPPAGAVRSSGR